MKYLKDILFLVITAFLAASGTARAGLIVLSGDSNITSALSGTNGSVLDTDDQRFFTNVLGGGTRVLVQGNDSAVGATTPVTDTNAFYNTVPGVTSSIQSGLVTASSLLGINLFVTALPNTGFTLPEITALSNFSAAGGSLFLLGDGFAFSPTQNANLNALLTGLGSSMQLLPTSLDPLTHYATGTQILANRLTTGITNFEYAFTSSVSGGTALFNTTTGVAFISANVPEPGTTAMLMGFGLAGAGIFGRRLVRPRQTV